MESNLRAVEQQIVEKRTEIRDLEEKRCIEMVKIKYFEDIKTESNKVSNLLIEKYKGTSVGTTITAKLHVNDNPVIVTLEFNERAKINEDEIAKQFVQKLSEAIAEELLENMGLIKERLSLLKQQ